ncbi:MAG: ABC-type transport auxiliary lipoprotein family protein [Bacteroidales bacterium]
MKRLLIAIMGFSLLLAGCFGGKSVAPTFYLIEYPFNEEISADNSGDDEVEPIPIHVLELDVHPAFSSHEIAIREDTHELKYFANHKWTNRPEQTLTIFMQNFFGHHNGFMVINPRKFALRDYYSVEFYVNRLEVVKNGKQYSAYLHMEITLREGATSKEVFKHVTDRSEPMEERNLNLFASAVSRMLFEEIKQFSQKVEAELVE